MWLFFLAPSLRFRDFLLFVAHFSMLLAATHSMCRGRSASAHWIRTDVIGGFLCMQSLHTQCVSGTLEIKRVNLPPMSQALLCDYCARTLQWRCLNNLSCSSNWVPPFFRYQMSMGILLHILNLDCKHLTEKEEERCNKDALFKILKTWAGTHCDIREGVLDEVKHPSMRLHVAHRQRLTRSLPRLAFRLLFQVISITHCLYLRRKNTTHISHAERV